MKVVIVYDSVFGNTAKVAKAIADAFGTGSTVSLAVLLPLSREAPDEAQTGRDL